MCINSNIHGTAGDYVLHTMEKKLLEIRIRLLYHQNLQDDKIKLKSICVPDYWKRMNGG